MASLSLQGGSIPHHRDALNTCVLLIYGSIARLWSTFYSESHPFRFKGLSICESNSVDTEIVGLLNHSRGGASIASLLNARENLCFSVRTESFRLKDTRLASFHQPGG